MNIPINNVGSPLRFQMRLTKKVMPAKERTRMRITRLMQANLVADQIYLIACEMQENAKSIRLDDLPAKEAKRRSELIKQTERAMSAAQGYLTLVGSFWAGSSDRQMMVAEFTSKAEELTEQERTKYFLLLENTWFASQAIEPYIDTRATMCKMILDEFYEFIDGDIRGLGVCNTSTELGQYKPRKVRSEMQRLCKLIRSNPSYKRIEVDSVDGTLEPVRIYIQKLLSIENLAECMNSVTDEYTYK